MAELLEKFSVSECILFIALFALAIKGIVDFVDWAKNRLRDYFGKEVEQESNFENIESRINAQQEKLNNEIQNQNEKIDALENGQMIMRDTLTEIDDRLNILIESDKDDIKSYITRVHHHYCYELKWIDDFTLECCENRFRHYLDEGGEPFIKKFMEDLRALPNVPQDGSDYSKAITDLGSITSYR